MIDFNAASEMIVTGYLVQTARGQAAYNLVIKVTIADVPDAVAL